MRQPVGLGFMTIRGVNIRNTFGKGIRTDARTALPRNHDGWDIACMSGSPVYAILDGSVEFTNDSYGGYGKSVVLKVSYRSSTYYILYAHLMRIDVKKGQAVKEAERLGLSGQTGNAAGQAPVEAHLHFEVPTTPGGGAIDPGKILGYQPVVETIMSDFRAGLGS